jgi:hypothetical protein
MVNIWGAFLISAPAIFVAGTRSVQSTRANNDRLSMICDEESRDNGSPITI